MSKAAVLPPGPGMPPALQTAIWFRRAQWMMSQCAARFGETFTLRILHEGPWVMLSNPEHLKQVFTGDPKVFHAGEGNRILLPVLGSHSLLLLDEAEHMQQRKLLLPQFHGARMQSYRELMQEVAAAEIESWPSGEPYRLRPRMQALTLEIILRAVFGLTEGERIERLRCQLRNLLDLLASPRMFVFPLLLGPERMSRFGPFQSLMRRVDGLIYDEISERRDTSDLEDREDIMSLLLQARDAETGEPMRDVEGQRPVLGRGAPGSSPGQAGPAEERGHRRRDPLPGGRCHGDAEAAPGDLAGGPAAHGACPDRRLGTSRGRDGDAIHLPGPSATRRLSQPGGL
jgi:cytochrome P450 family 135